MPTPHADGVAVIELEAWYQIRRTEEEAMEMGTIDKTLLHDHGARMGAVVGMVTVLGSNGA